MVATHKVVMDTLHAWFSLLYSYTILSGTILQAQRLLMSFIAYFAIYFHKTQLAFHFKRKPIETISTCKIALVTQA